MNAVHAPAFLTDAPMSRIEHSRWVTMMSLRKLGDTRQLRPAPGRLIGLIAADASGQDLIEYGLLASLIAVASVGAVSVFGISVSALWSRIVADLSGLFS